MPLRVPSLSVTKEGLKRIGFFESQLFQRIKTHPQKCIVVAGTNGKGSVCATLERLLSATGARVGLYTSPHLVEATERIRLGEQNISKKSFCEHYEQLCQKTQGLSLSHFEALTLLAIHFYMEALPEYLILEVGMGGLWDSTNAVPHGTAVLTTLGLDHEKFLGRDLLEIARNKFGIIRQFENLPEPIHVVHPPLSAELVQLKKEVRERVPSLWHEAKILPYRVEAGVSPKWFLQLGHQEVALSLMGRRGVDNSSLALEVLKSLGFDPQDYVHELSQVKWPGRMEALRYKDRTVYLSGDHNPQGIDSLLEILEKFTQPQIKILFGMGKEKDLEHSLPKLLDLPRAQVHLTVPPFKGRELSDYLDYQSRVAWCEAEPLAALNRLCAESKDEDLILVTGSLYLVGEIRGRIL